MSVVRACADDMVVMAFVTVDCVFVILERKVANNAIGSAVPAAAPPFPAATPPFSAVDTSSRRLPQDQHRTGTSS
jgi:hypothetical protein